MKLQFRLRTLMIVVAIIALLSGAGMWVVRERERLIRERDEAVRSEAAAERQLALERYRRELERAYARWNKDHSILFTESADPLVHNGVAYDAAELDLNGATALALPKDAVVERNASPGCCRIEMKKELCLMAHPVKEITIAEVRTHMGCATRREGDVLAIGTFGEYDTHIEGGMSLVMRVSVPKDVIVERREELSGPGSVSNKALKPKDSSGGRQNDGPTERWTPLKSKPSPVTTAWESAEEGR